MATDRHGETVAVGTDYVVVAPCVKVSGTDVVLGTEKSPVTVASSDIVKATKIPWADYDDHVLVSAQWVQAAAGSGSAFLRTIGNWAWMRTLDVLGIAGAAVGGTSGSGNGASYHWNYEGGYWQDGSAVYLRFAVYQVGGDLYRIGFHHNALGATADFTDGFYLEYDSSVSANWYGCEAAGGTRQKTSTGLTATAQQFQWIGFHFIDGTTGMKLYNCGTGTLPTKISKAGSALLTMNTNVPTVGSNRGWRVTLQANGANGSGGYIFLDRIAAEFAA